ncbi:MAG: Na+/H+ antiporter family protein [bacterium ADurb.Bin243]|nr:MAG: Na+/H+ antiporter family protein [bacterium ADurb.Bin243]
MAIMMPVAYQMAVTHAGASLIPILSGAVVSGAISGAHLVPYSDKSVMTAAACKITPVYHVKTQFLNVVCAIAASIAGYLLAGATSSYLLGFLVAAALISAAHFIFAR